MISDPCFGALPVMTMLEVLTLIPESGAFLSSAETDGMQVRSNIRTKSSIECSIEYSVQLLALEWLNHAYVADAPFPSQLPASQPVVIDQYYRLAVLECACKWATLPSTQGLSLGLLSLAPCFEECLRKMDLTAMPMAGARFFFLGECRRRTPRAATDLRVASERSLTRHAFGYLQTGVGPSVFAVGMLRDIKTHSAGDPMPFFKEAALMFELASFALDQVSKHLGVCRRRTPRAWADLRTESMPAEMDPMRHALGS